MAVSGSGSKGRVPSSERRQIALIRVPSIRSMLRSTESQVQRQGAMAVEGANGGPLGRRLGDPGPRQFLDDALGTLVPRTEQAGPAEMGVDRAASFPHADDARLSSRTSVRSTPHGSQACSPRRAGSSRAAHSFGENRAAWLLSFWVISLMRRRASPSSLSRCAALVAVPPCRRTRWRTWAPLRTDLPIWTLGRSPAPLYPPNEQAADAGGAAPGGHSRKTTRTLPRGFPGSEAKKPAVARLPESKNTNDV